MAKAKSKTDNAVPSKKYSDKDMAAFKAALDTEDVEQPETAEATVQEPPVPDQIEDREQPVESGERKIPVETEEVIPVAKRGPAAPPPTPPLEHVLGKQPPEEMQHLTKKKQPGFRWGILIGVVALLAAASLGGFFFFSRAKKFTNTHVQLQFQQTVGAESGSTLTLTVEYQNLEPVDLTNAELNVEYPEGFTYAQSQPTASQDFHNSFALGTVRSGQSGKVTITGTIVGAVGDVRDFAATLTYRPATFNSDFQQKASTEVKITSSILGLALDGPTQLAPGAAGTWTITYTNTSDHDLPTAKITATYPSGFSVTNTNPVAQEKNAIWNIQSVKQGASGKITVTGTIDGNLGDSFSLKVSAGIVSETNTIETQDEQSLLIILVKTGVTTTIAVNGSTDPQVVNPGDTLNYSIRVSNTSDNEVTDVTVAAKLDGSALDTTSITSDTGGKYAAGTVIWTKNEVATLSDLQPAASATMTFSVKVVTPLTVTADADKDRHVTATVSVTSPSLTANANSSTAPATVAITKVATVLTLSAEARYYDQQGVTLGSGPIPPTVGKTTTYRVIWTVTNTTSDAGTLVVTARLPNSVLWTGQNLARDAGDLSFDPDSRIVRWSLNVVPAGTGGRLPALSAHFDVSITPTPEQLGTVPVLIEAASATATDNYSKASLTSDTTTLSADVPNDAQAGGEGQVVSGS